MSQAQTEFKRVAEANVTLPCLHRLHLLEPASLDIEWLLKNSEAEPKVVITYAGGNIYHDMIEEQKGRVSFASNFLSGDASLEISLLQPSDSGQYTCKVKNAGQYEWTHITLKVLDLSNPAQIIMKNLTWMFTGSYQCTASNEAGEESCVIQVTVQRNPGDLLNLESTRESVLCDCYWSFYYLDFQSFLLSFNPREDAEAPKARLVKPGSSSLGSRSSHSGSSSTRSTENSASRSQQTLSTEATPHLTPTQHSPLEMNGRKIEPKRSNYTSLIKTEVTPTTMPAQRRAFQTV
ncbi:hypothetical protein E2320_007152 [Naja naja]|nr:hypothetical protein E2320_007152 [Naja naja]